MFIFEVTTPGTSIIYNDECKRHEIERLLDDLKDCFFEANMALNLFTEAQQQQQQSFNNDNWEKNSARRSELFEEVSSDLGNTRDFFTFDHRSFYDDILHEVDVRFNRERWATQIPESLERKKVFIFAKAFLQSLDGFEKFLKVISQQEHTPEKLKDCHAEFGAAFPHLRGVRNTVQHMEDRSRGLSDKVKNSVKQRIDFQKPTKIVDAPEGVEVLILNTIMGTNFGCTKADGHYGEVDVSPESMQTLQKILHDVLNAFEWEGMKRHEPRA
ncbi:hypothetical protein [Pseudomonas monteilii]|uniref:Uncharacterized protein n=1 Tax=Pseudomonas monteilii TaxID=76759 RepID=A0A2N1IME6_9PSED|nr:hypothetical protein [Pseudomonas monteilii]PKI19420.1 hypothetical protein CXB65_23340 [Pseudomonas monteilii]RPD91902.1 hypothetical protein EGN69_15625 [Pseudomonas monteilii]